MNEYDTVKHQQQFQVVTTLLLSVSKRFFIFCVRRSQLDDIDEMASNG